MFMKSFCLFPEASGRGLAGVNKLHTHLFWPVLQPVCVFEGSVWTLARYAIIFNRREQHELMFWAFLLLFKGNIQHSSDCLRFTASCG